MYSFCQNFVNFDHIKVPKYPSFFVTKQFMKVLKMECLAHQPPQKTTNLVSEFLLDQS